MTCLPTVFSGHMKLEKVMRGGQNRFVIKIVHVKDDLFVVGYGSNEVALVNIETGEEIKSITVNHQ